MLQPVVVCPVGAAFCGVFIVQPVVVKQVMHPVAVKPVVVQSAVVPPVVVLSFVVYPVMVLPEMVQPNLVLPVVVYLSAKVQPDVTAPQQAT